MIKDRKADKSPRKTIEESSEQNGQGKDRGIWL